MRSRSLSGTNTEGERIQQGGNHPHNKCKHKMQMLGLLPGPYDSQYRQL
jgi:hypothetical protein